MDFHRFETYVILYVQKMKVNNIKSELLFSDSDLKRLKPIPFQIPRNSPQANQKFSIYNNGKALSIVI